MAMIVELRCSSQSSNFRPGQISSKITKNLWHENAQKQCQEVDVLCWASGVLLLLIFLAVTQSQSLVCCSQDSKCITVTGALPRAQSARKHQNAVLRKGSRLQS